jgi:hypothetical protein
VGACRKNCLVSFFLKPSRHDVLHDCGARSAGKILQLFCSISRFACLAFTHTAFDDLSGQFATYEVSLLYTIPFDRTYVLISL